MSTDQSGMFHQKGRRTLDIFSPQEPSKGEDLTVERAELRSLRSQRLDGETFVADAGGMCWVKFVVKQVEVSPERPHGLNYLLSLHDDDGKRLLGFDNAHPVHETSGPGARTRIEYGHKHKGKRVRFYVYADASTLLADFWTEVEAILKKRSTP